MKKGLNILLLIMVFMMPNIVLAAGSASGSAPETVEKGNSFNKCINNTICIA